MHDQPNPSDVELAAHAATLRMEADSVLHDAGLRSLIGQLGRIGLRGSYALDLMTWRDLDLSVELPAPRPIRQFFDVGRAIATTLSVAQMRYSEWALRRDSPFDHGLYWGIVLIRGQDEWKVDLWGYRPDEFVADEAAHAALKNRLERLDRMSILRLKHEVCHWPEYRNTITSLDVYRAVEEGVVSVTEFRAWLNQRST